jgi:hypothetical protein
MTYVQTPRASLNVCAGPARPGAADRQKGLGSSAVTLAERIAALDWTLFDPVTACSRWKHGVLGGIKHIGN